MFSPHSENIGQWFAIVSSGSRSAWGKESDVRRKRITTTAVIDLWCQMRWTLNLSEPSRALCCANQMPGLRTHPRLAQKEDTHCLGSLLSCSAEHDTAHSNPYGLTCYRMAKYFCVFNRLRNIQDTDKPSVCRIVVMLWHLLWAGRIAGCSPRTLTTL